MDGLPQFDFSKITIEVSKTVMILAGMSFYAVLNTVGRKKRDVDVLVVGFGSAGGVAALQAYEENPNVSVMVLERFDGGGSSTRSAGIVYAGGGTNAQKALGIDDTKENMFNYLKQEIGTAIDDASLKEFCDTSAENMRWLREDLGVSIDSSENPLLCPYKSSTPPGHYTLMYSGSEGAAPFNTLAKPAPRGHRAMGKGHFAGTGNVLFEGIERAVLKRNDRIEVNRYTKAVALLTDPANPKKIIGCRVQTISHIPFFLRWVFDLSYFIASTTNPYHYYTNAILEPFINLVEFAFGKTYEVSVKKGVILAAGGFQRNYNMVNQYAEPFYGLMPIGGAGEDGSGINMALSLGAKTNMLQKCSAWRFILPPDAFAKGIIVDQQGKRLLNEDVYGARLSEAVMVKAKGNGWLVIDQKLYDEAYEAIHGGKMIVFQQYFTYINLLWNRYSANTIADLERKCGITPGGLAQSLKRYNDDVKSKDEDTEFHKDHKYIAPIETGPFYAINFSKTASSLWPCPFMTLGGLVVDGKTGLVIGTDDKPFVGLYACGRNAAGVPSSSYVSGLSLADCIFSGRRAGRSVAHT